MSQNSPYIFSRDGTSFSPETGKLYIFSKSSVHVLKAWPRPMAWKKTTQRHQTWMRFRPSLSWLEGELRMENKLPNSPWLQWYETIPEEIRELLNPFRKRKWHLLSLIVSCGSPAVDLIRSNPALAFALASNWVFHTPAVSQPLRSARALLRPRKKQVDIMRWLGFPPTESSRRLLQKYPANSITITGLLNLRQIQSQSEYHEMLSHQPSFKGVALSLLAGELRTMMTPNLLTYFNQLQDTDDRFAMENQMIILKDTAEMFRQIHGENVTPPRFNDHNALLRFHDQLSLQINYSQYNLKFPTPPIPGTSCIVPLRTPLELLEEGREQHNCVVSYSPRVAQTHSTYIYRMLHPERCTLEIRRESSGKWRLVQIRGCCNSQPSTEAIISADYWLKTAQQ